VSAILLCRNCMVLVVLLVVVQVVLVGQVVHLVVVLAVLEGHLGARHHLATKSCKTCWEVT